MTEINLNFRTGKGVVFALNSKRNPLSIEDERLLYRAYLKKQMGLNITEDEKQAIDILIQKQQPVLQIAQSKKIINIELSSDEISRLRNFLQSLIFQFETESISSIDQLMQEKDILNKLQNSDRLLIESQLNDESK